MPFTVLFCADTVFLCEAATRPVPGAQAMTTCDLNRLTVATNGEALVLQAMPHTVLLQADGHLKFTDTDIANSLL